MSSVRLTDRRRQLFSLDLQSDHILEAVWPPLSQWGLFFFIRDWTKVSLNNSCVLTICLLFSTKANIVHLSRRGEGSSKKPWRSHEDCRENHRDYPSIYGLYVHAAEQNHQRLSTRLAPCSDTNAAHTTSDRAERTVQSRTKHKERKIRTLWTKARTPQYLIQYVQYFFPFTVVFNLFPLHFRSLVSLLNYLNSENLHRNSNVPELFVCVRMANKLLESLNADGSTDKYALLFI